MGGLSKMRDLMRIVEENSRPDNRWIATEVLDRAGWEIIGSGSFGSVYEKDGVPYVLKLYDADDDAYKAFLSLVQRHPNPHFPKLVGKPMRVSPGFYGVRMEKLGQYHGMPDLFAHYLRYRDVDDLPADGWAASRLGDAEELFYEKPDLKVALDLIHTLTPPYQLDITPHNIMVRGTTVVFIDPVCNPRDGLDRPIIPVKWRAPKPVEKPMSQKMRDMLDDDALMRELLGEVK